MASVLPQGAISTHGSVRARRAQEIVRSLTANVRAVRLRRGLTQEQLAERADLSTTDLQQIEYGRTIASVVTLVALVQALDVEPGALLVPAKLEREARTPAPRSALS
jgi:transcriptional regulator with XRE-family HTH domain